MFRMAAAVAACGALASACSASTTARTPPPRTAPPRTAPPHAAPAASPRGAVPPGGFESPEGRDHPLAGAIVRVRDGSALEWDALLAELAAAAVVLLGERHDNPDHHRLQAELYAALAHADGAPAAAFEMLDAGDQDKVEAVLKNEHRTPAALAEAVSWERSGWPPFSLYAPVFEAVLRVDAPVLAAGLPRDQAMALARGAALPATGAFDDQLEARYGLSEPLAPALQTAMRDLMQEAHCGMLPEAMLDGMVRIQRIRDALLAEAARLGVGARGRAVVFAGAGHVRRDRAAAALLAHVHVAPTAAVALLEVDDARTAVADYLPDAQGAFDYVILTARRPAEDHCAELRKRFAHPKPDDTPKAEHADPAAPP